MQGIDTVKEVYGSLDNIKIITLAPELEDAEDVIQKLSSQGIVVSVGKDFVFLLCLESINYKSCKRKKKDCIAIWQRLLLLFHPLFRIQLNF